MQVLSYSFHVSTLLLKFSKVNFYCYLVISQAILDVLWLMGLKAQIRSDPPRLEDDTVPFGRGKVLAPTTTYVHKY